MNKILSIDEENLQAIVEPGVINEALQIAVKEKNLFYPPVHIISPLGKTISKLST